MSVYKHKNLGHATTHGFYRNRSNLSTIFQDPKRDAMAPKQTKQTKALAKKPPPAQGTGNKSGTETDKTKDPGRKVPGKKAQAKTTGLEEEEDRTTSKMDKNTTNAKATKKPAAAAGRGQGKSEKKKATAVKKLKLKSPRLKSQRLKKLKLKSQRLKKLKSLRRT